MLIEYQMGEGLKDLAERVSYIGVGISLVVGGYIAALAFPEEPTLSNALVVSGLEGVSRKGI